MEMQVRRRFSQDRWCWVGVSENAANEPMWRMTGNKANLMKPCLQSPKVYASWWCFNMCHARQWSSISHQLALCGGAFWWACEKLLVERSCIVAFRTPCLPSFCCMRIVRARGSLHGRQNSEVDSRGRQENEARSKHVICQQCQQIHLLSEKKRHANSTLRKS